MGIDWKHIAITIIAAMLAFFCHAQVDPTPIPPRPTMQEVMKDWGPNDRTKVSAIWYGADYDSFKMISYAEEENIWVSKLPPAELEKVKRDYNRLRNAVYVCYPYARIAGNTINQINREIERSGNKKDRKLIIKAKEEQLRKQFAEPLSNLSVYQGKVLMKLISRQTGNNCYSILREYKGGWNARVYQTVAFFYGGNLKQGYNVKDRFDRDIENFVAEINTSWYNNPYRNPAYIRK